jgi:hypothetical protein
VVVERVGRAIRFHTQFLEFASHYRFEPRPVNIARGNEKGRVERVIRYLRNRFFVARHFKDLDDLNLQALNWCEGLAMERRWPEDSRRSVGEAFLQEKKHLLALPSSPYPCDERIEVTCGKAPYVRFDLNDYSVPHTLTRKTLVVVASLDTVRILDENNVVATHPRSYDRGQQIEDPRHIESLLQSKSEAAAHHNTNSLVELIPSSAKLLESVAHRGLPLVRATAELTELLRTYGPEDLEAAVSEALLAEAAHPQAVRHILERNRRENGKPPARPVVLPDDPRVKNLFVRPHDLKTYDHIASDNDAVANTTDQDQENKTHDDEEDSSACTIG